MVLGRGRRILLFQSGRPTKPCLSSNPAALCNLPKQTPGCSFAFSVFTALSCRSHDAKYTPGAIFFALLIPKTPKLLLVDATNFIMPLGVLCGLRWEKCPEDVVASRAAALEEYLPRCLEVGDPWDCIPQLVLFPQSLADLVTNALEPTGVPRPSPPWDSTSGPNSAIPTGHTNARFHTRVLPVCNLIPACVNNFSPRVSCDAGSVWDV